MAVNPLTQAIIQGMDPGVYRPLSDIQTGDALQAQGMDASPTSGWGALGRLAQALAGTYLSSSATSDLAKTIGQGKKSAQDQLMAAIEASQRPPPSAAPPTAPLTPPVQQPTQAPAPVAAVPGSPNAEVAARFPAEMSPQAPNQAVAGRFPADMSPPGAPTALAPPAAPAAVPDGVAAINNAIQPRGIRNNNPLNIEDGPFAKSQPGYAGSDGRFAKFQTPDQGAAAADALLTTYHDKHGLNTVAGIVGRWAPTSDGNNVSAYASDVAGHLGIDPNAPIPPEMRPQLIAAMARHENGQAAPGTVGAPVQLAQANINPAVASDAQAPAARAAASGLDVHKLMAVLQNPYADDTTKQLAQKLLLKQLTPEEDEFASSPQGIFNKRTGELKQGQAGAGDMGGLQGPARLEALKQADPDRAAQALAVLQGRVPYPTGSRLNSTQQRLKDDVTAIDSNFSAAKWQERSNFQKSMGGTAPATFGGQVRSAGTVAKHLGDAYDALPVLEKGTLGASDTLPSLNYYKGAIRNQTGDTEYQNAVGHYETARKGLSDEVETLLAGGHGAEGSKAYWLDRLDINKHSPTEVRGALDEFRSLMNGRLSNVAQEKDRVFGDEPGHTDPLSLFGPKERDIMDKIQKGATGTPAAPTPSATSAPVAPDRAAVEAEMRKRGLIQ